MSQSQLVNSTVGYTVSDANTRYAAVAGRLTGTITDVAEAELPVRDAGDFSQLYVFVPTNTVSVNTTITLQKSQVDTALILTVGADQTGAFEDTSNTVTFAATDEVNYEVTAGSEAGTNSITIEVLGVTFTPDTTTNTISWLATYGSLNPSTASTTWYFPPSGTIGVGFTTETTGVKYRVRAAFTASNFYSYVTANARTTDTIITTRLDGGIGGGTVTYSGSQTGVKEDTSNTDSLVAGSDFNYALTTGTGTGNITVRTVSNRMVSTADDFAFISSSATGSTETFGLTFYLALAGSRQGSETTQANSQLLPRFTFTGKELGVFVNTNTNDGTCSVTVQDNGSDSAMTVSYTTTQTGLKNDSVNTTVFTSGTDEANYKVITGGTSGDIGFVWLGMLGNNTSATPAVNYSTTQFFQLMGIGT